MLQKLRLHLLLGFRTRPELAFISRVVAARPQVASLCLCTSICFLICSSRRWRRWFRLDGWMVPSHGEDFGTSSSDASKIQVSNGLGQASHQSSSDQLSIALHLTGGAILAYLNIIDVWRARSVGHRFRQLLETSVCASNTGHHMCISENSLSNLFDCQESNSAVVVADFFGYALSNPPALEERDCAGRSPLMKAAQFGSFRFCAALLAARADPEAKGPNDWTALHYAAIGTCAQTCKLLIEHRSSLEARSKDGCSPLFYAYRAGEDEAIMQLFHRHGARPDTKSQNACGTADAGYLKYSRSHVSFQKSFAKGYA